MDRVAVTLILGTGTALTGEIFLSPGVLASSVLDEAEPFVPVAMDNGVRLVARAAIAALAVPGDIASDPDFAEESLRARVHLVNGTTVEGDLRWVALAGYRRTVDHLNLPARILAIHGAGVTTYIIKAHVAWVEEC